MIGVGSAKGDVITFNFEEQYTGLAKKVTRASAAAASVNTFWQGFGHQENDGSRKEIE